MSEKIVIKGARVHPGRMLTSPRGLRPRSRRAHLRGKQSQKHG